MSSSPWACWRARWTSSRRPWTTRRSSGTKPSRTRALSADTLTAGGGWKHSSPPIERVGVAVVTARLGLGRAQRLRAFPEDLAAELATVIDALDDRGEVVPG